MQYAALLFTAFLKLGSNEGYLRKALVSGVQQMFLKLSKKTATLNKWQI